MEAIPLEDVVRNIDARLEHVEQILPRLATRDELRDTVAVLATKDELRETAVAIRAELREESERTRRHFDVVADRLEGHIRLMIEVHDAHRESTDRQFREVRADIARLDRRR